MSSTIWDLLGVPPGSDRKAIRRGYAARLKEVHPEDDPEGFKALREAFETAQWHADAGFYDEFSDEPAESADVEAAPAGGDWDAPIWPEALAPDLAFDPETQPYDTGPDFSSTHKEFDDRLRLLLDALSGDAPADPDALLAVLDGVLESPEMDEIAVHARVEGLLAYHLASTLPRSDPLLERAVHFFGWAGDEIHAARDWNVDSILGRIRERQQIGHMAFADHPLHRGWRALTDAPVSGLAMRWDGLSPDLRAQVAHLLELSEYELPALAGVFVPERAEWWRAFLARPRISIDALLTVPFTAFFIYAILGFFGRTGPGSGSEAISLFGALALPFIHLSALNGSVRARAAKGGALPAWLRDGWLAAGAGLPLAVALVPATGIGMLVTVALAIVLFGWVSMVVAPRPPAGRLGNRIGEAIALLWPLGIVAFLVLSRLGFGEGLQWTAVATALAFVWVRACGSIVLAIGALVPRWQTAVALGLAIGLVAVSGAIGAVLPTRAAAAAALAAAAGWIMLQGFWANEPEKNKFLLVLAWLVLIGHMFVAAPMPASDGAPPMAVTGQGPGTTGTVTVTPYTGPWQRARCPEAPKAGSAPRPPAPCSPERWISAEDGSELAQPGMPARTPTELRLTVSATGELKACDPANPAQARTLFEVTCDAIYANARFLPAADELGRPSEGIIDARIDWPPLPPPKAKAPGLNEPLDARRPFAGAQVKCPPEPKRGTGPLPLRPCGTFTDWMSLSDYPIAARGGDFGETRVLLLVTDKGKPTSCRVKKSSGSKALDDTTCRVLKRGRYLAARDEEGRAIGTELTFTMGW